MTPEQLREGAALLAEARAARVPDDPIALAPEHWAWNRWLRTHAAELLALAKCIEAAKALRADYYEAGICCDGGRAMREFDAAIDAARASGADEP